MVQKYILVRLSWHKRFKTNHNMDTQNIITVCFVISTALGLIGVYVKLIKTIDNQEKLIEGINQRLSNVEYNQRNKLQQVQQIENRLNLVDNLVGSHKQTISEQQVIIKQLEKYTTQIFERLNSISENQVEIKDTVKEIEKSVKVSPTQRTKKA